MFCGRGMGGGSGSGGGMLRSVGRAVARVGVSGNGIQDPFSATSNATGTATSKANSSPRSTSPTSKCNPKSSSHLSLSSPVNSHSRNPVSGLPSWHSPTSSDDNDWVSLDGSEVEGIHGFSGAYVFGPAPSEDEVDDAVYALQQVFWPASHVKPYEDNCGWENDVADHVTITGIYATTDDSEIDWKEPSSAPYDSGMQLRNRPDGAYYAFHLLQTEPAVQRMVRSISSDKSVWDAVLNNKVVQELKEAFSSGGEKVPQSPDGTSSTDSPNTTNTTTNVVKWLFDTARAKFMEVVEKVTKIVNELFQHALHKTAEGAESPDPFSEKLRASFMLSIMVLLVVVVSRAHRA